MIGKLLAISTLAALAAISSAAWSQQNGSGSERNPRLTQAPVCDGCFALVGSGGGLAGPSKDALSATKLSTGTYDVRFRYNIDRCAWSATIGLATFSGSVAGGEITTAGRVGTTSGVFVQTFNSAGALADKPFHLIIQC